MKKVKLAFLILAVFFSFALTAKAQDKVDNLIEQLHGKARYYNQNGESLGFFSSWTIRHYEENTRIWAARLLAKMVTAANREKVLQALLEVLKDGADDRDTGDGIIFNRSEIAFALARIGDGRAVKPLLQTLLGKKTLPLINAKAGPAEIKLKNSSSNINIIRALGTFKGTEAENAATLLEQILLTPQETAIDKELRQSIDILRNGTDLPIEMFLVPGRP